MTVHTDSLAPINRDMIAMVKSQPLEELEKHIADFFRGGILAGYSLVRIKAQKLFAARGYADMTTYLMVRWNVDRARANELMDVAHFAVSIAQNCECIEIPCIPAQVRMLKQLNDIPLAARAWQRAVETAKKTFTSHVTGDMLELAIKRETAVQEKVKAEATMIDVVATPKEDPDAKPFNGLLTHNVPPTGRLPIDMPSIPFQMDKIGNQEHEKLAQKIAEMNRPFADAIYRVRQCKAFVRILGAREGGKKINVEQAMIDLRNVELNLRHSAPFRPCCYCMGDTTDGCDGCNNDGWLSRGKFHQAPTELQKQVEVEFGTDLLKRIDKALRCKGENDADVAALSA